MIAGAPGSGIVWSCILNDRGVCSEFVLHLKLNLGLLEYKISVSAVFLFQNN